MSFWKWVHESEDCKIPRNTVVSGASTPTLSFAPGLVLLHQRWYWENILQSRGIHCAMKSPDILGSELWGSKPNYHFSAFVLRMSNCFEKYPSGARCTPSMCLLFIGVRVFASCVAVKWRGRSVAVTARDWGQPDFKSRYRTSQEHLLKFRAPPE